MRADACDHTRAASFPVFHFRGTNALLIVFKREEMLPVSVVAASRAERPIKLCGISFTSV